MVPPSRYDTGEGFLTDLEIFTNLLDSAGIEYDVEPLGRELEDWEWDRPDEYGKRKNDYYWVVLSPYNQGVTALYHIKFQFNADGQLVRAWDEP